MKVSALYGDRLSPTSQEKIVETAKQNMDALSNTTRKLEESRKKMEEVSGATESTAVVDNEKNVEQEKAVDNTAAVDNAKADQMLGVGRNLDVIVSNS